MGHRLLDKMAKGKAPSVFRDRAAMQDALLATVPDIDSVARRHWRWEREMAPPKPLPAGMTSKPCPYTIDGRWTLQAPLNLFRVKF